MRFGWVRESFAYEVGALRASELETLAKEIAGEAYERRRVGSARAIYEDLRGPVESLLKVEQDCCDGMELVSTGAVAMGILPELWSAVRDLGWYLEFDREPGGFREGLLSALPQQEAEQLRAAAARAYEAAAGQSATCNFRYAEELAAVAREFRVVGTMLRTRGNPQGAVILDLAGRLGAQLEEQTARLAAWQRMREDMEAFRISGDDKSAIWAAYGSLAGPGA